jgi:hypothetical protein
MGLCGAGAIPCRNSSCIRRLALRPFASIGVNAFIDAQLAAVVLPEIASAASPTDGVFLPFESGSTSVSPTLQCLIGRFRFYRTRIPFRRCPSKAWGGIAMSIGNSRNGSETTVGLAGLKADYRLRCG